MHHHQHGCRRVCVWIFDNLLTEVQQPFAVRETADNNNIMDSTLGAFITMAGVLDSLFLVLAGFGKRTMGAGLLSSCIEQ